MLAVDILQPLFKKDCDIIMGCSRTFAPLAPVVLALEVLV